MDTPAPPTTPPRSRHWTLLDTLRSLAGGPGYDGPPSDHFDGHRFFNPDAPAGRSFKDFLRWQRTRQRALWPSWVENRAHPQLPTTLGPGQVALTFINHITFLLQLRGLNILTDPVYSERVSPFRSLGPKRVRDPGLPFDQLPPVHLVLISHNHYDHLDIETLIRLEETHSPRFITPLGNRAFLREFGLRTIDELDWWQSVEANGASITLTPAQHWSSRGPRNRNRTLWGGFVVRAGEPSSDFGESPTALSAGGQKSRLLSGATQPAVYFAGDTGYGKHFRAIRERCGKVNLALLPIGAYEPRWFMRDQHMNPDDAVRAHLDLEAEISIATHFGCFQLTDEGIDDPVRELATARARHRVQPEAFQVLETGETRLFESQPTSREASSSNSSLINAGPR
jgi:L-ascorbate metabolism protein UlaG (beta-lactamase superfamily)